LLGFLCIGFTSGCAAAIAWTTPTVGLGCRSFNFILYVVVGFVTAYVHVLRSWMEAHVKGLARPERASGAENAVQQPPRANINLRIVNTVYFVLSFGNALVVIIGTIFHLVGVFRTCWCERLTWADDTMVELNSKTQLAYDNAKIYWLSTAYVAFGVVWLICLVAITFRAYIVIKMHCWVAEREKKD
jgi:hypothetical protein